MSERTYPYTAWVLLPSFKPKSVELVKKYKSYTADYGDLTEAGKLYSLSELFPSKREAVEAGWLRVDKQKTDLDKKLESLKKRREQLRLATGELAA